MCIHVFLKFIYLLFIFTIPVNDRETLVKPPSHGAQTEGCPAEEGGTRGGVLFDFLLRAQAVVVATLLEADDSVGLKASMTLSADHLIVVLLAELAEGSLDDATLQAKHRVQVDCVEDGQESRRRTATEPGPSTSVTGQGPPCPVDQSFPV